MKFKQFTIKKVKIRSSITDRLYFQPTALHNTMNSSEKKRRIDDSDKKKPARNGNAVVQITDRYVTPETNRKTLFSTETFEYKSQEFKQEESPEYTTVETTLAITTLFDVPGYNNYLCDKEYITAYHSTLNSKITKY